MHEAVVGAEKHLPVRAQMGAVREFIVHQAVEHGVAVHLQVLRIELDESAVAGEPEGPVGAFKGPEKHVCREIGHAGAVVNAESAAIQKAYAAVESYCPDAAPAVHERRRYLVRRQPLPVIMAVTGDYPPDMRVIDEEAHRIGRQDKAPVRRFCDAGHENAVEITDLEEAVRIPVVAEQAECGRGIKGSRLRLVHHIDAGVVHSFPALEYAVILEPARSGIEHT